MKETLKKLWKDESAQGATEYILLLVVLVGAIVIFKPRLEKLLTDQTSILENKVNSNFK